MRSNIRFNCSLVMVNVNTNTAVPSLTAAIMWSISNVILCMYMYMDKELACLTFLLRAKVYQKYLLHAHSRVSQAFQFSSSEANPLSSSC
jgi:hypothetical protein